MLRIGHGYDVHRLATGRPLVVGAVEIPSETGLLGHSDADVLTHAIVDALLGALALGDIGTHFPDTDPRWEGADSQVFLRHAVSLLAERGASVVNVDTTIIAQKPRMAPHIAEMRRALATSMDIDAAAVSIKATTPEKMGAFGRGEGIAAHAVVLVEMEA